MAKYLLDTNIIIYYLNNDKRAIAFIDKYLDEMAISSITYLEVLIFSYDADEDKKVRSFLDFFTLLDIDMPVIEMAINTYRSKKVKIADNLIGSTAMLHNLTLVTRNTDDFKNMNLKLLNIYT